VPAALKRKTIPVSHARRNLNRLLTKAGLSPGLSIVVCNPAPKDCSMEDAILSTDVVENAVES
jgi:hypothetical protein